MARKRKTPLPTQPFTVVPSTLGVKGVSVGKTSPKSTIPNPPSEQPKPSPTKAKTKPKPTKPSPVPTSTSRDDPSGMAFGPPTPAKGFRPTPPPPSAVKPFQTPRSQDVSGPPPPATISKHGIELNKKAQAAARATEAANKKAAAAYARYKAFDSAHPEGHDKNAGLAPADYAHMQRLWMNYVSAATTAKSAFKDYQVLTTKTNEQITYPVWPPADYTNQQLAKQASDYSFGNFISDLPGGAWSVARHGTGTVLNPVRSQIPFAPQFPESMKPYNLRGRAVSAGEAVGGIGAQAAVGAKNVAVEEGKNLWEETKQTLEPVQSAAYGNVRVGDGSVRLAAGPGQISVPATVPDRHGGIPFSDIASGVLLKVPTAAAGAVYEGYQNPIGTGVKLFGDAVTMIVGAGMIVAVESNPSLSWRDHYNFGHTFITSQLDRLAELYGPDTTFGQVFEMGRKNPTEALVNFISVIAPALKAGSIFANMSLRGMTLREAIAAMRDPALAGKIRTLTYQTRRVNLGTRKRPYWTKAGQPIVTELVHPKSPLIRTIGSRPYDWVSRVADQAPGFRRLPIAQRRRAARNIRRTMNRNQRRLGAEARAIFRQVEALTGGSLNKALGGTLATLTAGAIEDRSRYGTALAILLQKPKGFTDEEFATAALDDMRRMLESGDFITPEERVTPGVQRLINRIKRAQQVESDKRAQRRHRAAGNIGYEQTRLSDALDDLAIRRQHAWDDLKDNEKDVNLTGAERDRILGEGRSWIRALDSQIQVMRNELDEISVHRDPIENAKRDQFRSVLEQIPYFIENPEAINDMIRVADARARVWAGHTGGKPGDWWDLHDFRFADSNDIPRAAGVHLQERPRDVAGPEPLNDPRLEGIRNEVPELKIQSGSVARMIDDELARSAGQKKSPMSPAIRDTADGSIDRRKFIRQLRDLDRRLREGIPYSRNWYRDSGRAILNYAKGNLEVADKIASLFAIYSPQKPVSENLAIAFRVYEDFRLHPERLPQAGSEWQRKLAQRILRGEDWFADVKPAQLPKVRRFYANLLKHVDTGLMESKGFHGREVTADGWIGAAFDYFRNTSGALSKTQIESIERVIQAMADNYGLEPEEVQAAIWTSIKAERDDETQARYTSGDPTKKEEALAQSGESFSDSLFKPQYTLQIPHPVSGPRSWTSTLTPEQFELYTYGASELTLNRLRDEGFVVRLTDGGVGFRVGANGKLEQAPHLNLEIAVGDVPVTKWYGKTEKDTRVKTDAAGKKLKDPKTGEFIREEYDKPVFEPTPTLYYKVRPDQRAFYDGLAATIGSAWGRPTSSWARRFQARSKSDTTGWRITMERAPTAAELERLNRLLEKHKANYHATPHHDGFSILLNKPDRVLDRAVRRGRAKRGERADEVARLKKSHEGEFETRNAEVKAIVNEVFEGTPEEVGYHLGYYSHRGGSVARQAYQRGIATSGSSDVLRRVGDLLSADAREYNARWRGDTERAAQAAREHRDGSSFEHQGKPRVNNQSRQNDVFGASHWLGTPEGHRILYLTEKADASTVLHELVGHATDEMRKYYPSEFNEVERIRGKAYADWDESDHEWFARSVERYFDSGYAPTPELVPVFNRIKSWMRAIYAGIRKTLGPKVPPETRFLLDTYFGGYDDENVFRIAVNLGRKGRGELPGLEKPPGRRPGETREQWAMRINEQGHPLDANTRALVENLAAQQQLARELEAAGRPVPKAAETRNEAAKLLDELTKKHDAAIEDMAKALFGPIDKAEVAKRNVARGKAKRLHGRTQKSLRSRGLGEAKLHLEPTVKEQRAAEVRRRIEDAALKNPDDPTIKAWMERQAEIERLDAIVNPDPETLFPEMVTRKVVRKPDDAETNKDWNEFLDLMNRDTPLSKAEHARQAELRDQFSETVTEPVPAAKPAETYPERPPGYFAEEAKRLEAERERLLAEKQGKPNYQDLEAYHVQLHGGDAMLASGQLSSLRKRIDTRRYNQSLDGMVNRLDEMTKQLDDLHQKQETWTPEEQDAYSQLAAESLLMEAEIIMRTTRRERDLRAKISDLEHALDKGFDNPRFQQALDAMRWLAKDREQILLAVLGDEKYKQIFENRTDLLADWLVARGLLKPDFERGTAHYYPMTLEEPFLTGVKQPAASLTGNVVGKTRMNLLKLHKQNQMILWQRGNWNADPAVLLEAHGRALGFAWMTEVKKTLYDMARPLTQAEKRDMKSLGDSFLINPNGTPLDAELRGALTGSMAESAHRFHEANEGGDNDLLEMTLKNYWDAFAIDPKQLPQGFNASAIQDLRILPKDVVRTILRPLRGGGTRGGELWDFGTTMARFALIYSNVPGYMITNATGNLGLLLLQGPFRLPGALRSARHLLNNRALYDRILAETGDPPLFASISRGRGQDIPQLARIAEKKLLDFESVVDRYPRAIAWISEARHRGYKTESDMIRLLDGKTAKTARDREYVNQFATNHMIDFNRLSDFEKQVVTRLFFIWPFVRGSTAWPFWYAKNYPGRTAVGMSLGLQAYQQNRKRTGPVPPWYENVVALEDPRGVGAARTLRGVDVNTTSPTSMAAQELRLVHDLIASLLGRKPDNTSARFIDLMQPFLQDIGEAVTQQTPYGQDVSLADVIKNNLTTDLVPGWRLMRALRDSSQTPRVFLSTESGSGDRAVRTLLRIPPRIYSVGWLNYQAQGPAQKLTTSERIAQETKLANKVWAKANPGEPMDKTWTDGIKMVVIFEDARAAYIKEHEGRSGFLPHYSGKRLVATYVPTPWEEANLAYDIVGKYRADALPENGGDFPSPLEYLASPDALYENGRMPTPNSAKGKIILDRYVSAFRSMKGKSPSAIMAQMSVQAAIDREEASGIGTTPPAQLTDAGRRG